MVKEEGYYVFTPLHGERFVRIHRADCRWAHIAPNHPDREESWHWFATYGEAVEYARHTGRSYDRGLNCRFCRPN